MKWIHLLGYGLGLIVTGVLAYQVIFLPTGGNILDNLNLLIHEAGHMVFAIFGELVGFLGGTILQLLMPGIFTIYFWTREDFYAVGFCLFWLMENLVHVGRYIADAQVQILPLLGGGQHDWTYLLGRLGILSYAEEIGTGVFVIGVTGMTVAIGVMGFMTYKYFDNRRIKM